MTLADVHDADAEARRQQSLDDQELLDTPADPLLDTLVRLTQDLFGVRTVLISLIDCERHWFKARIGAPVAEIPRTPSFCGQAILGTQPYVIEDTHLDASVCSAAVVIGEPFYRFYAGQPLFSAEGQALGTLCIMHTTPMHLDDRQLRQLKDMATLAEGYLKLLSLSEQTAQLRAALSREQRKVMLDPLTQLWNRAGLNHFLPLEHANAQAQGTLLGVLYCDLDHFKSVNDRHGHDVGDHTLWQTARSISAAVRPHDVVTRSGGEEFVVLLHVRDTEELQQVAERIRQAVRSTPIQAEQVQLDVTISIGAAVHDASEALANTLKRADQALYTAKRNGRDRVELAAPN